MGSWGQLQYVLCDHLCKHKFIFLLSEKNGNRDLCGPFNKTRLIDLKCF
jgi:hypothetical protein